MSTPGVLKINVILLIAVSSTVAQVSAASADRNAPQEGVVIEHLETKIVFQSDGTYTRDQKSRVHIQSDAGVQEYGVLRPPYHSSIERIEVLDVRVTKPNGMVIVTPLDQIQDAPFTLNGRAFEYSDLREKHVPIKGLEVGDTLTSSIQWRVDKPQAVGQFWFGHWFLRSAVVLDEELEIRVPKEREVKLSSHGIQPIAREERNLRIYTWKTSNSDSQTLEKQKEAQSYDAIRGLLPTPDVLISSFRTWEEVGRWYESLQHEKIQPTPEIKTKAAELTKGLTDEDAKLRAIYDYVSLRFHYVGTALESGDYQPHSANEILANQYGDCKDKHTLLASLLAAVGIRAYPAVISTRTRLAEDVPSPGQFDHVISVVPQGSTLSWMDTTPEVTAMGYLATHLRGKPALVIMPDKVEFQTTPPNPPFPSKYTNTVTAKLDADGTLQAHVEATYRGNDSELNYRYLFRRVPESQWKDFAQKNFYGARLGGTITSVGASSPEKTEEPFTVTYEYTLMASVAVSQTLIQPRQGVVTLFGYGTSVRVDRGHLILEDGIGTDRRQARFPRVGHGLRRLVVIGSDGMISLAALRWLADQDASFVMLERDGTVLAATGPVRPSDSKLRRAQALAHSSGAALRITRELITQKLAGQEQVARNKLLDTGTADTIAQFRAEVPTADSITTIRLIESQAARAYWSAWSTLPVNFPKSDLSRVPDHWRSFGARVSPLTGSPRLAANPPNAILNYLYCVLESEARLAAAALGLDPGLGVLHVDTPARDSLACDLMEPVRSQIDAYLLDWITRQPLRREWFFEQRDGNCRLMGSFAVRLSETAPIWGRAVAPIAEWTAQQLWSTTRKRTEAGLPPTHLTQTHRREAKGASSEMIAPVVPRTENLCPGCGKTIQDGSASCARCAVGVATKNMLKAARIGRRTANGPNAQVKRATKARQNALAQHSWKPSDQPAWLTPELFTQKILPLLSNVPTAVIRSSIGVSKWYASKIRQGYRPHPRHWQVLADLVRIKST